MTVVILGKSRYKKNPAIKDWIVENKKNGRPILLNSENSLKLKRLRVNQSWSSFRQTAKVSLFSAFLKTETNFLLNRKDFFAETTAKCPEKRYQLATFRFYLLFLGAASNYFSLSN